MSKIGIVTVLYNSETVLTEFFETLNVQTFTDFTLYVVDNKSPDNSLELTKSLSSKMDFRTVVIENEDNYGVAKGNNIGIKEALKDGCEYILLSNNDVVLEPQTIESLLSGLENSETDMAVPKIFYHGTDLIWAAGGKFTYYNGSTKHFGGRKKDDGRYDKQRKVSYSPTCFMIIKREVFEKVGFMDENYFVYYDDTDFIWRCRENGVELFYLPQSVVYHKESTSTGGQKSDFVIYYMERNRIYFTLKNIGGLQSVMVKLYNVVHNNLRKPFVLDKKQLELARKAQKEGRELHKKFVNGRS
ncbi:MAG: glycosyltransferase family 2 protein [Rikenellaceae bacterium]|nr:glycosyltransferase family 2 protein [Rikenellaceae bacterium]